MYTVQVEEYSNNYVSVRKGRTVSHLQLDRRNGGEVHYVYLWCQFIGGALYVSNSETSGQVNVHSEVYANNDIDGVFWGPRGYYIFF